MDFADLASRTARGSIRLAARIGKAYAHYRPVSASRPALSDEGRLEDLVAFVTAEGTEGRVPEAWGSPGYLCQANPALIASGDYLVDPDDRATFFITSKAPFGPAGAVRCNDALRLRRIGGAPGGDLVAAEVELLAAFPAFVGTEGGAGRGSEGLPDAVRAAERRIFLPLLPVDGPRPLPGDILVDRLGRRLRLHGAEAGPLGWKATGSEARV